MGTNFYLDAQLSEARHIGKRSAVSGHNTAGEKRNLCFTLQMRNMIELFTSRFNRPIWDEYGRKWNIGWLLAEIEKEMWIRMHDGEFC